MKIGVNEFSRLDFNHLGNFVIQSPIEPNEFFKRLSPVCVPSLRVTTYKPAQQAAIVLQSGIRLGLEGSPFILGDNCIRVAIKIQDGCTHDFGFNENWEILQKHSETGVSLSGLQIPKYKEIKLLWRQLGHILKEKSYFSLFHRQHLRMLPAMGLPTLLYLLRKLRTSAGILHLILLLRQSQECTI